MANKLIKGDELMLFVEGKSIAFAKNHTLSINVETIDNSIKTKDTQLEGDNSDGKWSSSEAGIMSWSATSENLLTFGNDGTNYEILLDKQLLGQPIDIILGMGKKSTSFFTNDDLDFYLKGKAIITKLDITAQSGEKSSYSVDFTGVGKLVKTTSKKK